MNGKQPILLVEDDIVDALTVERALNDIGTDNPLVHVQDGEGALKYLTSEYSKRPELILLDLNMPGLNGIEFLEERAKIPKLRAIPLIVLTTSKDQSDVSTSFKNCISGYMVKPVDYDEFVELMRVIIHYWSLSQLPNE